MTYSGSSKVATSFGSNAAECNVVEDKRDDDTDNDVPGTDEIGAADEDDEKDEDGDTSPIWGGGVAPKGSPDMVQHLADMKDVRKE